MRDGIRLTYRYLSSYKTDEKVPIIFSHYTL
jgi:hypothetical protein